MTCRCARRDGPRAHCRIPHGTALVPARGPLRRHRGTASRQEACRRRGEARDHTGSRSHGRLIATLCSSDSRRPWRRACECARSPSTVPRRSTSSEKRPRKTEARVSRPRCWHQCCIGTSSRRRPPGWSSAFALCAVLCLALGSGVAWARGGGGGGAGGGHGGGFGGGGHFGASRGPVVG